MSDNDSKTIVDLQGELCPFPVVKVVSIVEKLQIEESIIFLVDDPLAIKSIPEELEDEKNIKYEIRKEKSCWEIEIKRVK